MFDIKQTEVITMFANLESFSIFFFTCLSLIALAILFEDKLVALETKREKKAAARRAAKKHSAKSSSQVKKSVPQANAVRRVPAQRRTGHNIAA